MKLSYNLPRTSDRCEIMSLILRHEQRLRVFENKLLGILQPKKEEVTGVSRQSHNRKLHYPSHRQILLG
jgi:hypothetical protein